MRIGERQRGMVHRQQLVAAGLSHDAIRHRRQIGWLHPVYNDVFLVGRRRLEALAHETAAVLQMQGCAIVSDDSAAFAWRFTEEPSPVPMVTLVGRDRRSRRTLRVRRVTRLHPDDLVLHQGLPVTSPARTIVDRAGGVSEMELENDLFELRRRSLATDDQILAAIDRATRRKGVALLREMVLSDSAPQETKSPYERKLRALLRAAELPQPRANIVIGGCKVDLAYPEHGLIVEFDSARWHSGRNAFETDRLRDQKLVAAGWRVIRITARQLDRHPYAVVARIAQALAVTPLAARPAA
jgi:very-short-patch-repair endonuclease